MLIISHCPAKNIWNDDTSPQGMVSWHNMPKSVSAERLKNASLHNHALILEATWLTPAKRP